VKKTDIIVHRKKGKAIRLLFFILIVLVAALCSSRAKKPAMTDNTLCHTLLIDSGHGGIDGGAVSADGIKESEINLAIALKMHSISGFLGIESILTRSEDVSVTNGSDYSERAELEYRAALVNATKRAVYIGIHQNCYITSEPSGCQVFYATTNGSEKLGKLAMSYVNAYADIGNRRLAAPAEKNLYITSNVTCPAILVECGFMSNANDVKRLSSKQYQTKFSLCLISAYLNFDNHTENV